MRAILLLLCAVATAHALRPHHAHGQRPCLEPVWARKMHKHRELVANRKEQIAANVARFTPEKNAYDAFEATYSCLEDDRVGTLFGDGGKFVCGEATHFRRHGCLVYSVGSAGDASFEKDVIARFGCEVHSFDPSGDTAQMEVDVSQSGSVFHAWGVGASGADFTNEVDHKTTPLLSVHDIMERLGHAERHIDILKIDCEGCEYKALAAVWPQVRAGRVSIGQIQVEMHGTDFAQAREFFDGAEAAGYMIFHKERNHWGCAGYMCVEYALIHVDDARAVFDSAYCGEAV
jgi:hypothetical protein